MARVVNMLTWTAILTLPGGVLLLPVLVAQRLAKRRKQELPADEAADAAAEPTESV